MVRLSVLVAEGSAWTAEPCLCSRTQRSRMPDNAVDMQSNTAPSQKNAAHMYQETAFVRRRKQGCYFNCLRGSEVDGSGRNLCIASEVLRQAQAASSNAPSISKHARTASSALRQLRHEIEQPFRAPRSITQDNQEQECNRSC